MVILILHLSLDFQTLIVLLHNGNVCFQHKVEVVVEVAFIRASFGRFPSTGPGCSVVRSFFCLLCIVSTDDPVSDQRLSPVQLLGMMMVQPLKFLLSAAKRPLTRCCSAFVSRIRLTYSQKPQGGTSRLTD